MYNMYNMYTMYNMYNMYKYICPVFIYNVNINSFRLPLQFLTLHPILAIPTAQLIFCDSTRIAECLGEFFGFLQVGPLPTLLIWGYFTPLVAGGPSCGRVPSDPLIQLIWDKNAWLYEKLSGIACCSILPPKLTWNPRMEVWKMIFLFKQVFQVPC